MSEEEYIFLLVVFTVVAVLIHFFFCWTFVRMSFNFSFFFVVAFSVYLSINVFFRNKLLKYHFFATSYITMITFIIYQSWLLNYWEFIKSTFLGIMGVLIILDSLKLKRILIYAIFRKLNSALRIKSKDNL